MTRTREDLAFWKDPSCLRSHRLQQAADNQRSPARLVGGTTTTTCFSVEVFMEQRIFMLEILLRLLNLRPLGRCEELQSFRRVGANPRIHFGGLGSDEFQLRCRRTLQLLLLVGHRCSSIVCERCYIQSCIAEIR